MIDKDALAISEGRMQILAVNSSPANRNDLQTLQDGLNHYRTLAETQETEIARLIAERPRRK